MSGTLSVPSLPTSLPGMIVLFSDQEKTDPPCVCRVLPVVLIMVPFGVIAKEYRIVHDANDCSCWYCPLLVYSLHTQSISPLLSHSGVCQSLGMSYPDQTILLLR